MKKDETQSSNNKIIFDRSQDRNFEDGIGDINQNFDKFQIDGSDLYHQNLSQNDDDDDNEIQDLLEETCIQVSTNNQGNSIANQGQTDCKEEQQFVTQYLEKNISKLYKYDKSTLIQIILNQYQGENAKAQSVIH